MKTNINYVHDQNTLYKYYITEQIIDYYTLIKSVLIDNAESKIGGKYKFKRNSKNNKKGGQSDIINKVKDFLTDISISANVNQNTKDMLNINDRSKFFINRCLILYKYSLFKDYTYSEYYSKEEYTVYINERLNSIINKSERYNLIFDELANTDPLLG